MAADPTDDPATLGNALAGVAAFLLILLAVLA